MLTAKTSFSNALQGKVPNCVSYIAYMVQTLYIMLLMPGLLSLCSATQFSVERSGPQYKIPNT